MAPDRFNLLRRNSLRNEVDGVWEELERLEDGPDASDTNNANVSHSECLMLQRVLADHTKVPSACRITAATAGGSNAVNSGSTMPDIVRRLTGGVPGAFSVDAASAHKELGGPISQDECRSLFSLLTPSAGGTAYLMPSACTRLRNKEAEDERSAFEADNDLVYKRLRRRMTEVARQNYPPTFT